MWNRKLRFVALLTSLLLVGFLSTSYISYFVAHESVINQIEKTTLPLTSDNIYSEIQRDLLRPIFISSIMAQDTFVRDWIINGEQDEKAIIRFLKEIQIQYGTITSFFVSEKTRKYYHSSGVLKVVSKINQQDSWYFRVQNMHQDYEINVDVDTAKKQAYTIFINHRVYDYNGVYLGAIGVGLAVEAVKSLIEDYKNRYGRQIYFIDTQGNLTLRGTSHHGTENIRQEQGLSIFANEILSSANSSFNYEKEGKKTYLNSRFVPEFDWYLIVEQQQDEDEMRIQNTLIINLLVSAVISLIIIFLVYLLISRYQHKLETMAATDKLTGAANRQIFEMLFSQARTQAKRRDSHLSMIMLDIDYFKQVNDTYGHPTGDVVLKKLTHIIKENIRESDILFRWGGEEFLIILPECDQQKAVYIAEKIRSSVENESIKFAGKSLSITISLGVASLLANDHADELVSRSDKALYKAKENGRNRVEMGIV
ncbi:sensor domain-containing diguanylate cyclase [sulfur-oxidizing endosymbiont of Gigantopelta aegis]|uniref:sensor domain-containing diguanylate cyclase n=1 Tax=sulfur-oxidizing endosymbiont of Gigantopelta aegis TaxID=2794934 RepID=UPI0018DBC25C|nr:sensor domain-containing diguanylate cyclase [sulfur-oxidizing endosymbiont of Gigantopelta aegis]